MTDIDPALREAGAKDVCRALGWPWRDEPFTHSDTPERCRKVFDAAICAVRKWEEENGFVTVPREPTEAMLTAGEDSLEDTQVCKSLREMGRFSWRAMVTTALPDPPQPKEGAER